jgi:hypothetical protein
MLGEAMAKDLLSFGVLILALGDEAQLPPIGDRRFFTSREPDFQLTEIRRQEAGSPIIQLATEVRQKQPLIYGSYGDSAVNRRGTMLLKDLLNYDQVIVGTHRKRQHLNKRMRELLGHSGELPNPGEKIVCLKNNREKGLLNGTLWTVKRATPDGAFIELEIENDLGHQVTVVAPSKGFTGDAGNASEADKPVHLRLCADLPQGTRQPVGLRICRRSKPRVSRGPLAVALYGHHPRRGTRHGAVMRTINGAANAGKPKLTLGKGVRP